MTYQPKSVGKMAEFETFDPLYLPKFKSYMYIFLQGLTYRVLSVPCRKFDSQPSSVFELILLPTPCCHAYTRKLNFKNHYMTESGTVHPHLECLVKVSVEVSRHNFNGGARCFLKPLTGLIIKIY